MKYLLLSNRRTKKVKNKQTRNKPKKKKQSYCKLSETDSIANRYSSMPLLCRTSLIKSEQKVKTNKQTNKLEHGMLRRNCEMIRFGVVKPVLGEHSFMLELGSDAKKANWGVMVKVRLFE